MSSQKIFSYLSHLCKAYFSSLGTIWLFVQIHDEFISPKIQCSLLILLAFAFIIAIGLFFINGYFFEGFLKKSIVLKIHATNIIIKFGDLFKQDGWKAIAVNDFFDSEVDDMHVSAKSLHGIVLNKFWKNNITNWDQQVSASLIDIKSLGNISKKTGKSAQHKIGTTAITKINNECFLCVALSKTNTYNLQASTNPAELYQAIIGLLKKSREVCAWDPLNIPLLGSGLARVGLKANMIVQLILIAIYEESKKGEITKEIRIILPKDKKDEINLNNILKDWSSIKI